MKIVITLTLRKKRLNLFTFVKFINQYEKIIISDI